MDRAFVMTSAVVVCLFFIDDSLLTTTTLTPLPAFVKENDSLELQCNYHRVTDNFTPQAVWFLNGTYVGSVELQHNICTSYLSAANKERYNVSCVNSRSYTLTIIKVDRTQNDNRWKCTVNYNDESNSTNIVVLVPVTRVTATVNGKNDSTVIINENNSVDVECTSSMSRPEAGVSLVVKNNVTEWSNVTDVYNFTDRKRQEGILTQVFRTFKFIPDRTFNNKTLYCSAGNGFKEVVSNNFSLDIRFPPMYPPTIEGVDNDGKYYLIENLTASIVCSVGKSNPPSKLSWLCDKSAANTDTSGNASVLKWTSSATIKSTLCRCTSQHDIGGPRNASVELISIYPPRRPQFYVNNSNISPEVSVFEFIEKTTVEITCTSDGYPYPKISWIPRQQQPQNQSNLVLANLNRDKLKEQYTCYATNAMIDSQMNNMTGSDNRSLTVNILYPPEFFSPRNLTAVEGSWLEMTCTVINGYTTNQTVSWAGYNSFDDNNSSRLIFPRVSRNNTDSYTCRVYYTLHPTYGLPVQDSNDSVCNLMVLYPPEQIVIQLTLDGNTTNVHLNTFSVVENVTLTMNCSAGGKPKPSHYNWTGIDSSNNSSSLKWKATRNQENNLTCNAYNWMDLSNGTWLLGYQNFTYSINVLYPPAVMDLSNITVLEKDHFEKGCSVTESQTTNRLLSWEGFEVAGNDQDNITLKFVDVNRNKTGEYTCKVKFTMVPTFGSPQNGSDAKTFYLDVLYPPEQIVTQLKVDGNTTNVHLNTFSVVENVSLTMNCSAGGNPEPSHYNWTGIDNNNSSSLQWKAVRKQVKHLTCNAYNWIHLSNGTSLLGHNYSSYSISVLYPPQLKAYVEENVTVGTDFSADCIEEYGNPTNATVCWTGLNSTCNNTLQILNATYNDSGLYNCTVHFLAKPTFGDPINLSLNTRVLIHVTDESNPGPIVDDIPESSFVAAAVAGALAGVAVVIAAIVTLYVVKKRRLLSQKDDGAKPHSYENFSFTPDRKHDKCLPAPPPPEEAEVEEDGTANNIAETEFYNPEDENPYANDTKAVKILKIRVSELFTYVRNNSKEFFNEEFEKFPKGLVSNIACTFARKPENLPLNRYQGIYPYDHSRVQILKQPAFFINANYIDGYARHREYIASLGPTERHTLGFTAFWNMVWYEKSDVIVMLTNLTEPSGMKCEQYWPDYGKNMEVDDFLIQSDTEEVSAEYTVRTFTVSKGEVSRQVTQLHYTAWPDKTVPESVISLIEFRERVKAAPTRSMGPLVVHCSAGVGRTGTYIALDRLVEEGKSTDHVNVFECVMSMRQQRVNMVQTPEQYVYLHQALVYCLASDIEPVTAETIGEYIQTTSNNVFSQLYQQLKQTVEKESDEYIEAQNKHASFIDWNRRRADIPGDRHRVLLSLDKVYGQSNYINAVYLASFLRLDHFIIAQSPLPKTVEDFVGMLYQESSACIVALDDYRQKGTNNTSYFPAENEQFSYGYFSIFCLSVEVKPAYVVRKLKLSHEGKHEQGEKNAYHFEFTAWKHDEKLPNDPKMFVQFVREIEDYAKESTEEKPHVVVHCVSGSERSGLFCAVSNLIQKMELEQQVSVVNMLRRVQERRKTAISSMEQLKFCYHAVNAFVKKSQHLSSRKKPSLVHYENNIL